MEWRFLGEISPRQLRQCYSCTARYQGCGEFLNPHYASKYIRSCPTSCIIFRNPHDLHCKLLIVYSDQSSNSSSNHTRLFIILAASPCEKWSA